MDFFRTRLSGLLNREVAEKQPMSEAALARQEILRALLRTPVRVGDDEYEALLAKVYEMALALHRNAGVDGDAACSDRNAGLEGESDSPTNARHREPQSRCGWEAIGFQAAAPDREFRGAGMLGLHCLLYALERHPQVCQVLLKAPFPFAAASINMTLVAARLAGVVEPGAALAWTFT